MEQINYIKIINKDVSKALIEQGFKYVKERINDEIIYAFIPTADLIKEINKQFEKQCFVYENKLRF